MNLLNLFFALLNGAVLIGFFGFLAKRYIVPSLKQGLQECLDRRSALHKQIEQGRAKLKQIRQENQEQSAFVQKQEQRVVAWKYALDIEHARKHEELKLRSAEIAKRHSLQFQHYQTELLRKKLLPRALSEARQQLHEHYKTADQGVRYLEQVVTRVGEDHG